MTQQDFQKRYQYDTEKDLLGEGGFGKVYKALDTYRHIWVAIKVSEVKPDKNSIRLRKETELVKQLPTHPNIAYYDECHTFSSFTGTFDFGILQYYEEGNLSQLMKRKFLSTEEKCNILKQLLEGIHFLHDNKVIHRDLKPQNILIVKVGNSYIPKITDFGISKELAAENRSMDIENSRMGAGTISYSSPEQLKDKNINKNTDLWSFGVIAFQLFTGKLPFTASKNSTSVSGQQELLEQINLGILPESISSIPEPWQTIIRQCLVPDPSKRVKNCKDCETIISNHQKEENEDQDWNEDEETRIITDVKKDPPFNKKLIIAFVSICIIILASIFIVPAIKSHLPEKNSNETTMVKNRPIGQIVISPTVTRPGQAQPKVKDPVADLNNALYEANIAFNRGNYDEAIKHYKKVKQLDPSDNTGHLKFLSKAKDLMKSSSGNTGAAKYLLQCAKSLQNTTEVNDLLLKYNSLNQNEVTSTGEHQE